jgi:hypothetical protein
MTLWITLTVISMVMIVASWINSKIHKESIDDDTTLSGFGFMIGSIGTVFFGAITILCI